MGPNVFWLAEALSQVMDLQPGMRVLDMGCGKAISSIFLARDFDALATPTARLTPTLGGMRRLCAARRLTPVFATNLSSSDSPGP